MTNKNKKRKMHKGINTLYDWIRITAKWQDIYYHNLALMRANKYKSEY